MQPLPWMMPNPDRHKCSWTPVSLRPLLAKEACLAYTFLTFGIIWHHLSSFGIIWHHLAFDIWCPIWLATWISTCFYDCVAPRKFCCRVWTVSSTRTHRSRAAACRRRWRRLHYPRTWRRAHWEGHRQDSCSNWSISIAQMNFTWLSSRSVLWPCVSKAPTQIMLDR